MPRKPGAQPGNKNALKHGIFSKFITPSDDQSMLAMSDEDRKDELSMARVAFKEAWEARLSSIDAKEKLSWDYAAHYWLDLINNLKSATIEEEQIQEEVWESFKDALRAANDRQGWKR